MIRFITIIFSSLLIGCTHIIPESNFTLHSSHSAINNQFQIYQLGRIMQWNNYSSVASCHREVDVLYLDYHKLMRSFGFNYRQCLEIQRQFNLQLEQYRQKRLSLEQQNHFFALALEQVQAQHWSLVLSQYSRINLIWIDGVEKSKLKRLLDSNVLSSGFPLFISMCKSSRQLESFLRPWIDGVGGYIGAESFARFDQQGNLGPLFQIDFSALFTTMQQLYLYRQARKNITGLSGKMKQIIIK